MIKALQYLTNLFNSAEDTLINAVSAIVPWLVPIVPAYLTFNHAHNPQELNLPLLVAGSTGFVVEALGLASMRTIFVFNEYNRKYKDSTKKAQLRYPIFTYVFYLVVILLVNVVLDWQNGVNVYHIIAVGLLSLLSVPAGVLISVRAQHTERQIEAEREKERQRKMREANKSRQNVSEQAERSVPAKQNVSERSRVTASQRQNEILAILERDLAAGKFEPGQRQTRVVDILNELELDKEKDKGYVSNLRKNWAETRGVALAK